MNFSSPTANLNTNTLSPEELAKLRYEMSIDNEPPPFSVRALVRAFDNKSPVPDISGTPLVPPCSHSVDTHADLSGSHTLTTN